MVPQKKIGSFLHLRTNARSLMCCNLDCITRALKIYFRSILVSTSARTPRAQLSISIVSSANTATRYEPSGAVTPLAATNESAEAQAPLNSSAFIVCMCRVKGHMLCIISMSSPPPHRPLRTSRSLQHPPPSQTCFRRACAGCRRCTAGSRNPSPCPSWLASWP